MIIAIKHPYSGGELRMAITNDRYGVFKDDNGYIDQTALYNEGFNGTNLKEFLTFTDFRIRLMEPATNGYKATRDPERLIQYLLRDWWC